MISTLILNVMYILKFFQKNIFVPFVFIYILYTFLFHYFDKLLVVNVIGDLIILFVANYIFSFALVIGKEILYNGEVNINLDKCMLRNLFAKYSKIAYYIIAFLFLVISLPSLIYSCYIDFTNFSIENCILQIFQELLIILSIVFVLKPLLIKKL